MKLLIWPLCAVLLAAAAPSDQQRAQALYRDVRCLVCAGETIADSHSDFAVELRAMINADIKAGLSDQAIHEKLSNQFGEQILMKPPKRLDTLGLWLTPFLCLGVGVWALWRISKRQNMSNVR